MMNIVLNGKRLKNNMFTFLVLFFNHLAYIKSQEFSKRNPEVESKFTGLDCLAFVSIPADVYLIYLMVSRL